MLFILAACGGSKQKTSEPTIEVRGTGFTITVPQGWRIARRATAVVARRGGALVSVTHFPLRKVYDESQFDTVATTLDSVAARLAKAAGSSIDRAETVTVDDRKVRAYTYGTKRIGFVLAGRDEYQLFCVQPASPACDLLFSSFTLTGPPA